MTVITTFSGLDVQAHDSLESVLKESWDSLNPDNHPFTSYDFLASLEQSGSVGGDTGWQPLYLTAASDTGQMVGAIPLYIKYHSYGEYVFDHSWAHAYEQAGGRYYPKLLGAVPFTPVPGPRLLIDPERPEAADALLNGLTGLVDTHNLSSAHITFITDDDQSRLERKGWMIRTGVQFHWHNHNYANFDGFLSSLSSRKRKNIRKERSSLADRGVHFQQLTGADITDEHWQKFYQFYLSTIEKKWGGAYLTEAFFRQIGQRMADRILLVSAWQHGEMIAGALNLIGRDALFGRNWGCAYDLPNLHFETCYYQAIDFAISRGLRRVEAGAQGFHKVQRGYLPVSTHSAHYLPNQSFSEAVSRFLRSETRQMAHETQAIMASSPYRQESGS